MRTWTAGLSGAALAAAALCGSLAGAGAYTVQLSGATAYLSDDPKACAQCHIMRDSYDGWQKASHHAVATCNSCHTPPELVPKYLSKAENGWWHSKGFTLQDFHEPIRLRQHNFEVLNRNCRSCHRELVGGVISHSADGPERFDCVRCHSNVGHGPSR